METKKCGDCLFYIPECKCSENSVLDSEYGFCSEQVIKLKNFTKHEHTEASRDACTMFKEK